MIGIVIALKSEAKYLLENIEQKQQIKLLDKTAYKGKLFGKDVVVGVSGIGKVSSAITTQKIIDDYTPEYIINIGSSGGTNNSVNVKEFYLIDKCIQFDFDVTEIDDVEVGYIQEYNLKFFPTYIPKGLDYKTTNLATADRFSSKEQDINLIAQNNCGVRDMEGGAIAQTCLSNNVKFICIKGISDVHGSGSNAQQFLQNLDDVCKLVPTNICKIFKEI